jgi:anti-sigma regulatory factor (Ser/Thr protein kinase)
VKILEQIKIQTQPDLIYAKVTLKNLLNKNKNFEDPNFLIFALMEISTNLIKHTNGGEIWFMQKDNKFLMAALDNGDGIKDISWAKQKGTTRMSNSLGLGLHQISNNYFYNCEIVSFTEKHLHGTIVLISSKKLEMDIVNLQIAYIGEQLCGDLIAKKGKFLLLADGSGHGKKAYKSIEFIRSYFYNELFSCIFIDDFFKKLHNELQKHSLRGAVLSIFEILKTKVNVCGVGNIALWEKTDNKYINHSQKDGIIGEVFSRSDYKSFEFSKGSKIIAATDGIDVGIMNKLLSLLPINSSPIIIALSAMFFASIKYDDKSIVIISNNEGEKNEC